MCSPPAEGAFDVEFVNSSSQHVSFRWVDFECKERDGPSLAAGERVKGTTYPGHIFRVRDDERRLLNAYVASKAKPLFAVNDHHIAYRVESEPYTEGTCSPKTEQGRMTVEFINLLNEPITMQWIGFDCEVTNLRGIPAHGRTKEITYPNHVFRFVDSTGRQLRSLDIDREESMYYVSDD